MVLTGQLIEQIFKTNVSNKDAQKKMIASMYERRTVIPMFYGDDNIQWDSAGDEQAWDKLREKNSICDVIFEYGGAGQANEVLEHILHSVSNVGLHYAFYEDWGVHRDSVMNGWMEHAIENGYYNADYGERNEDDENLRVWQQEYAYFSVASYWNKLKKYCPDCKEEFTLEKKQLLKQKQKDWVTRLD